MNRDVCEHYVPVGLPCGICQQEAGGATGPLDAVQLAIFHVHLEATHFMRTGELLPHLRRALQDALHAIDGTTST